MILEPVAIFEHYELAPFDESDPDDFRPNSRWAIFVDPQIDDLTVIIEEIAPGDCIPLHTHPISEVIVIAEGTAQVTLGSETRTVRAGAVVFVPPGTPHGTRNASAAPVRIHAMFRAEQIGIRYIERNPAPGTEGDEPQPEFTIDARAAAGA